MSAISKRGFGEISHPEMSVVQESKVANPVVSVQTKRPPESEPEPLKRPRVTSDTFENTNLLDLPEEILEKIIDECSARDLKALVFTSVRLRRIAIARLFRRTTGIRSTFTHITDAIDTGLKEIEKTAIRVQELQRKRVSLPADMIELYDLVERHGDRKDAEKLTRYLDFRDNLILWQTLGLTQFDVKTGTYEEFENAYNELELQKNPLITIEDIDISQSTLTSIPSDLMRYFQLRSLDASHNCITEIPKKIKNQIQLKELDLRYNAIQQVTNEIGRLIQLKELSLEYNRIRVIPESIGNLVRLKVLNLSYENEVLPESLGNLTQLEDLGLDIKQTREFPSWIGNLTCLQRLVFEGNRSEICVVPESFSRLTQLGGLHVYGAQISQIPEWVGDLTQLEYLSFVSNVIKQIPDSIRRLSQLKELNLATNQISEIPEWIGDLTQLEELNLAENEIEQIPDCVRRLPQLKNLNVEANPVDNPDFYS